MSADGADAKADAVRWAIFVAPHTGGIFTFYRCLSRTLGSQVCSVELEGEAVDWCDYAIDLAGPEHRVLPLGGASGAEAGRAIADFLERVGIDTVMVSPVSPHAVFDALPHLPRRIRVLVRLTEISTHGYRRALSRPEALDGIIVQCPRQACDIADMALGIPRHLLPNGVDTDSFTPAPAANTPFGPLRLLVLDRLVHFQKRILLLPRLCHALDALGTPFTLTVGGDGPDADRLRADLAPWISCGSVRMTGRIPPKDVPALMAAHDIYLKLSNNEGSPNAVIEAMAAGLPTVAALIPGVTDFVIVDGQDGRLVPSDDMGAMAAAVSQMAANPAHLAGMRRAARARAVEEFSLARFEGRVADLAAALPAQSRREPLAWERWTSSVPRRSRLHHSAKRLIPLAWRVALRDRLSARTGTKT